MPPRHPNNDDDDEERDDKDEEDEQPAVIREPTKTNRRRGYWSNWDYSRQTGSARLENGKPGLGD
jgi:hypothetical protein